MTSNNDKSYSSDRLFGLAVDPIHVGTGGARLGRVDNTVVRDPVTRVPKIPGSSLAGVYRTYVAMRTPGKYPGCAGQGQPDKQGQGGHCGQPSCSVCMCFGFASSNKGGFAGLAAFSDAHIVLFPVPTRKGPKWLASPSSLGYEGPQEIKDDKVYLCDSDAQPLNLGWLLLPTDKIPQDVRERVPTDVPQHIRNNIAIVSDKLFSHIVNSNLEVRTSVSINPATGAAEEGALFTYEAIPRGTVLAWDVTCRDPRHFKVGNENVKEVVTPCDVFGKVKQAHELLEQLGIGGMGTRGMGRLRVLPLDQPTAVQGGT
jgi:CRISPR-associated protein Cmr4